MYNDIAERNARAARYIAEKEFKRHQIAEARFEFLIFTLVAVSLSALIYIAG